LIAYGDDELFVPTMQAIAQRRAQVDHVLIETSGLALPTAVMEVLQGPELAGDFILDATLAVVDTPQLLSGTFEPAVATLFDQQLEYADVVVLNKIDALDEDALLQAEEQVRARAPNVRFLELASNAQLDIRLALGLRLHQPTLTTHQHTYTAIGMPTANASVFANQTLLNGHAHSGLAAHTHGLATHKHFHEQDPGWLSFTLRSQAPQPADKLKRALTEAAKVEPILRTKGFVNTTDGSATQLVQGVRARVTVTEAQQQSQTSKSELVFIGYHPSRARVAALLSDLTGTQWS
jgi:cobalamin biosynthesis protein CobW